MIRKTRTIARGRSAKRAVYSGFASVVLFVSASQVLAFTPDNHEFITKEGLRGALYQLASGEYVRFEDDVISVVADANSDVDDCTGSFGTCAGIYNGSDRQHFDGATLEAGTLFIDDELIKLMDWIRTVPRTIPLGSQAGRDTIKKAQRVLGQLLHTVQDFYAHSTWVERFWIEDGIPWADAVISGLNPRGPASFRAIQGKGGTWPPCSFGAAGPMTAAAVITSEYFRDQLAAAQVGLCVHGPSSALTCDDVPLLSKDFLACSSGIYSSVLDRDGVNGINKDQVGRPDFETALSSAQRATYLVATDVLSAIGAYSPDVLCAFTGKQTPCDGDVVVYTLASGGCYAGNSCGVGTGILSTPRPVEVTSRQETISTLSTPTQPQVSTSSTVQGTFLFESGPHLQNYRPRKVCRRGSDWIARNYTWSVEEFTPQIGTGYLTGGGFWRHWYGEMTLDPSGNVQVTYNVKLDERHEFVEPDWQRYRQVTNRDSFSQTTYRTNLNTGAGSWSLNSDHLGTFVQTSSSIGFPAYTTTTHNTSKGSDTWDSESDVPPVLLGVYLQKIRVAAPSEGVPAECTAQ